MEAVGIVIVIADEPELYIMTWTSLPAVRPVAIENEPLVDTVALYILLVIGIEETVVPVFIPSEYVMNVCVWLVVE